MTPTSDQELLKLEITIVSWIDNTPQPGSESVKTQRDKSGDVTITCCSLLETDGNSREYETRKGKRRRVETHLEFILSSISIHYKLLRERE